MSIFGNSYLKRHHNGKLLESCCPGFKEYFTNKPSIGAFHVLRFADEMYALTKPIAWTPGKDEEEASFKSVNVPKGFVTDFASVPPIFCQFLPHDGKYTYPAIVHDYLYWVQDRPRETADEIFRIAMKEFALDPIVINAVYLGSKSRREYRVNVGMGSSLVLLHHSPGAFVYGC